jgi:hypothetical protein
VTAVAINASIGVGERRLSRWRTGL